MEKGQWGLLSNLGEYDIFGSLHIISDRLGELEGHAVLQRNPVPVNFKDLYSYGKKSIIMISEKAYSESNWWIALYLQLPDLRLDWINPSPE